MSPTPTPTSDTAARDLPLLRACERLILELALDIADRDDIAASVRTELNDLGFDSVAYHGLAGMIGEEYRFELPPTVFFDVHTPATIARHLVGQYRALVLDRHRADLDAADLAIVTAIPGEPTDEPTAGPAPDGASHPATTTGTDELIAIVGMAAILPGSPDLATFWQNLAAGRDLIGEVPADRWDWRGVEPLTPIRWGGFIADVDRFDAPFFAISPTEAAQMDPQQRLFLETAWKALEDAGIRPSSLAAGKAGVFVGVGAVDYWELSTRLDGHAATGGSHAVLANRLSFLLDLHGPSEPVDTACSSSLVAVHRAVSSIRAGECDLAIAGGVSLMLTPSLHIALSRAGMLSPLGKCRTFGAGADGYVRGEGVGAIVLKPLSRALADGNPIHALIRATAINHGGRATSLTAPNAAAQADLVVAAWRRAGVDPASMTCIEAHGTGTALGDPIEVEALARAFATLRRESATVDAPMPDCGLGSVKTNIGHLEAAAGIAGLLKVVLAMRHATLPASLHCAEPNPLLALAGTPFRLIDRTQPWPTSFDAAGRPRPRRAGVSSFGFGGVNAHVVLEAADFPALRAEAATPNLFVLSARDDERLRAYADAVERWLATNDPSLAALCHTARVGREPMKARFAVIASDLADLRAALRRFADTGELPPLAAVEPGSPVLAGLLARWLAGETPDWSALVPVDRRFVSMPTYPFARQRHWCDGHPPFGYRVAALLATATAADTGADTGAGASIPDRVAAIVAAVLGHVTVDPDAALADLGADSILAAQIHGRIAGQLRVRLPLGAMIEAGTVARIAAMVAAASPTAPASDSAPAIAPLAAAPDAATPDGGTDEPLGRRPSGVDPLSVAQTQFAFLDYLDPGNPAFNLPGAIRVDGPFAIAAAIAGFRDAVAAHAALRSRIRFVDGAPALTVSPQADAPVVCVDLADQLPADRAAQVVEHLRTFVAARFDLAAGPLCRLLILELGDEDHIVALVVHHIVADAASVAILLREVVAAGEGAAPPAPRSVGYPDYAWWESRHLPAVVERELPWWRAELAGLPASLPLPFDRPRPSSPSYRGGSVRFDFDAATGAAILAFARQRRTTPFVVLLAAFQCLLNRLSDADDIAVGAPYANRSMPGTADMVGPLAYALILRGRLSASADFEHLLADVRRGVHAAFDHLYVPYTRLVEDLAPPRRVGLNPLFQVLFNVIPLAGLPDGWTALDLDPDHTDYDLSMRLYLGHGPIKGVLQFARDLFDDGTAGLIAGYFRDLVAVLVDYPDIRLDQLQLPEELADRKARALARAAPLHLRVVSTFTDRPLQDGIDHWARVADRPATVTFAGYNRLFQELYAPAGLLFGSQPGHNLLMVRPRDWLRHAGPAAASRPAEIVAARFDDLAEALQAACPRFGGPTRLMLLPAPADPALIAPEVEAELEAAFVARLAGLPGLHVRLWRDVAALYPVAAPFDPVADETGHVPYGREAFAALASDVARWMVADPALAWDIPAADVVAAIDRHARPGAPTRRQPFAAPETDLQRRIHRAFAATLGIDDFGIDDSFFDLGGHSLAAISLLSRIDAAPDVRLTVADVFMAPSVRALARRVAEGGDRDHFVDLATAAVLDPDIRPLPHPPAARPAAILLTGATGFVGRFLLREMLDRTEARIFCLLRAPDADAGMARLRATLQRWSLWRDTDAARLVAVPGDLAAPDLGLGDADHARLCREVDAICHNATSMNHLESFASARAANVDGVAALLRIAVTGRPKLVNYVSTLAVFSAIGHDGTRRVDETTPIDQEKHLFSAGYTTSKWVGEQLVHLAAARGIACNVFRLGLVTGDSALGRYDPQQSFHRLLDSCIRIGAGFDGYAYDLVITPVDYVARALVHLAARHPAGGGIFHLSSMEVTPVDQVFRLYNRLAAPPLAILPHRDWLEVVRRRFEAGETLAIMPLVHALLGLDAATLDRLTELHNRTRQIYDCSITQSELEVSDICMPVFGPDLFKTYLMGMQSENGFESLTLIDARPPRRAELELEPC